MFQKKRIYIVEMGIDTADFRERNVDRFKYICKVI